MDKQITRAITDNFGEQIWKRALIVLTHAQLSLPDRLDYEVFCSKRSEALLKFVSPSTWMKKKDIQVCNLLSFENSFLEVSFA